MEKLAVIQNTGPLYIEPIGSAWHIVREADEGRVQIGIFETLVEAKERLKEIRDKS